MPGPPVTPNTAAACSLCYHPRAKPQTVGRTNASESCDPSDSQLLRKQPQTLRVERALSEGVHRERTLLQLWCYMRCDSGPQNPHSDNRIQSRICKGRVLATRSTTGMRTACDSRQGQLPSQVRGLRHILLSIYMGSFSPCAVSEFCSVSYGPGSSPRPKQQPEKKKHADFILIKD